MAKMNSPFPFLGTLGEVSVYKNRLTDSIVVRMKGGPNKHQNKTYPSMESVREQNKEFVQCGAANSNLFLAVHRVKHLTDYVLAGEFTKVIKAIQCQDKIRQPGQREILISANRQFLEGFQFNRKNPFDMVFSHPISTTIDRVGKLAVVQIPDVVPGINFKNPWPYSLFRFVVCIGALRDMLYSDADKRYFLEADRGHHGVNSVTTDWLSTDTQTPGRAIEVKLQQMVGIDDHATLIVCVGIEFGTNNYNGITPVKHVGCAKVVALG